MWKQYDSHSFNNEYKEEIDELNKKNNNRQRMMYDKVHLPRMEQTDPNK